MSCCCVSSGGIGKFFGHFARRYRRRHERRGFETTQRQLLEGLHQAEVAGARLLEIGCGVGYLHRQLLRDGAMRALGVDISEAMLVQARELARAAGLADRAEYRQGDFVELAGDIGSVDVTVLDKVVCCYPDAEALVTKSLAKTRRVYALTYPRDHVFNRVGVRVLGLFLWLVRSTFRSYVHDPRRIEDWIAAAGFKKRYENQTAIWLTQVYVRE
ncbi:MAG: class I SAM-dependent methyltransferase [Pseudomonadota bacterium]|jgi:magnesium-protoporphyrin O-methyltransferase